MTGVSAKRRFWIGKRKNGNTAIYTAFIFFFLFLTGCTPKENTPGIENRARNETSCDSTTLAILKPADDLIRQTLYDSTLVYLTHLEKDPQYAWSQNPACYIRLKQKLGVTYSLLPDFSMALEQLFTAFRIADSIDNSDLKIEIYVDQAEVFRKQTLNREAVKMMEKADSTIRQNGAGMAAMAYYLDRNVALYPQRFPSYPPDSAFAENRRALHVARLAGNAYLEASALNELGMRISLSNMDSANLYWHQAGVIFDSLNCNRDLANTLFNIAWGETKANRRLKYLDSCRAIIGNHDWWYNSRILAEYYSNFYQTFIPNTDSALKYMKIEREFSTKETNQFAENLKANAKADTERKNQLIESNRELREEYKRRQFTFLVLAILLSIAAVFLFFWLRKRYAFRKLQETSDQLSVANAKLAINLEEKAILVSEIHHRVKNNFQLIANLLIRQAMQVGNPALKTEFEKARLRLLGMSTVHDLIYYHSDEGFVNLPEFLHALAGEILGTFERGTPESLHFECELLTVSHADAVHWGILLQELITNSGKYALTPGKELQLHISIRCKAKEVYFTYNDNGPGMPAHARQTGMGTYILDAMVRQFAGSKITDKDNPVIFGFTYSLS